VTRNDGANADQRWEHVRDLRKATFSLDGMADSAMTLAANFDRVSSDLIGGNLHSALLPRATSTGSYPFVAFSDIVTIGTWRNKEADRSVMADVQAIVDLCESHGTRVVLMINPVHADELEILKVLGYWQAFEDWKRELVKLAAKYPPMNGGSRVSLWDFTDYGSYSTEAVPTDEHLMRWFWEPRHYTRALGEVIVRRIVGGGDENFGVLLSSENIEPHLAAIREQQHIYREHHQEGVRRIHDMYESVTGKPPLQALAEAH
jgi:hypothetical protein